MVAHPVACNTRGVAGSVLLERERELAELAQAAREAAAGEGGLVLIFGEAGIGKSSLVRALRGLLPANGRLLVGHCDDLGTPRTLGPFRDLVGQVGAELTRALAEGGERDAVLAALRAELDWAGHPTVLVVEDVHWADEATLDVLGYLARRIAGLPAVLVLTYRDDELTREHPLQQLLGQASASGRVRRLPLRRLSEDAVRQLSAASRVDADEVFAMTSGNPFFVTEVLAAGDGDRVPSTVADAVLARVRRLDPATQDALEQLAVVPSVVERWLVDALVAGGLAALAAAEEHGLLTVSPASVAFRHELARRAVADSLPVARRVELNRRVLQALVGREDADLSRIVHHAAQAGDTDAIVGYGPAAARDAAGAGAHREAVAHYRLVLGHRERFAPAELAELLEGYAVECYTVGATEAPIVESEAVELRRSLGDQRALGADLRWLSRMQYWAGDRAAAERSGRGGDRRAGGGRRPPAARPRAQQPGPAPHAGLPRHRLRRGRRARRRPGPRGGRRRDPVPRPAQRRFRAVAARRPGGMVADGGEPAGRAGRRRGRARLPRLHRHRLAPPRRPPPGRRRAEPGGGHRPRRAPRPPRLPRLPERGARHGSRWPGPNGTTPFGRRGGGWTAPHWCVTGR